MIHPIKAVAAGVREWLNEPTPRKQMLPAYLILTIGIIVGFSRFEAIAEQRADDVAVVAEQLAADVQHKAEVNAYTVCLTRIDTRTAVREIFLNIVALFPDSQAATDINELIETEYPPLSATEECEVPERVTVEIPSDG